MIKRLLMTAGVSAVLVLTVATPQASAQYGYGGGTLGASSTTVTPGQSITVSGDKYAKNTPIDITIASAPTHIGSATTDANGAFSTSVKIPSSTGPGTHTISASGLAPDGTTRVLSVTITVTAAAPTSTVAFTGSNLATTAAVGALLIAFGTLIVETLRRRRLTQV
jgi:hypothetical protein